MSFNQFTGVGNLTRDIELRYAQSGSAIANTGLAMTRKFTQNGERKEEVCFIDVTFFGRSAEVANQYLRKGSKILVSGRIKFDTWVAQDGSKRSKHSVIAETMQMLDNKADAQSHTDYQAQEAPQQQSKGSQQTVYNQSPQQQYNPNQQQQSYNNMPPQQQEIDITDESIPF